MVKWEVDSPAKAQLKKIYELIQEGSPLYGKHVSQSMQRTARGLPGDLQGRRVNDGAEGKKCTVFRSERQASDRKLLLHFLHTVHPEHNGLAGLRYRTYTRD